MYEVADKTLVAVIRIYRCLSVKKVGEWRGLGVCTLTSQLANQKNPSRRHP